MEELGKMEEKNVEEQRGERSNYSVKVGEKIFLYVWDIIWLRGMLVVHIGRDLMKRENRMGMKVM